ncbi:MAG: hypothetical protein IH624_03360 [Phycisphaerae bacterium]|nr:hypothetical protein [Phycisphaerae bacterium]
MLKRVSGLPKVLARWGSVALVITVVVVLFTSDAPAAGQKDDPEMGMFDPFDLKVKSNNGVGTGEKPFPGVGPALKNREWIRIPPPPPFRSPFQPGRPR